MKKIKSNYSSGSGVKMMGIDPMMTPFKPDKMVENEPIPNIPNKKIGSLDGTQNFQYNSTPQKPMFQVKNKKKKDRIEHDSGND